MRTELSAGGSEADIRRGPRNHWKRLRIALDLAAAGGFYDARHLIDGMRYAHGMTDEILAIYDRQLTEAETRAGGGTAALRRINRPADYTGNSDPRLVLPFRRLSADLAVPKPYPWDMALPGFAGAGNNYLFLQEAAATLAGSHAPAIRRVHVLWSPIDGGADGLRPLVAALEAQIFDGRIDLTVLGLADSGLATALPGGGNLRFVAASAMTLPPAIVADADLVLFLSGTVTLDPMALQRMRHVAEVSDAVLLPLVPLPADKGFTTLWSDEPLRARFGGRYPFREVAGLNLGLPARLLREIGLPDSRFGGTAQAARELAYRAFVRGAWFVPVAVPALAGFAETPTTADTELYKALAPNHWDRKRDVWHEVPKVAVYIPAWNATRYIARAIDSVLGQDFADLEVCVANDGSTDGTAALLAARYGSERRLRWVDSPNGGIGFASNTAIRMSRSLYVGQLDSDDCLKPGAVRRLVEVLDEQPAVVCAYGSCERIDAAGSFVQNEYAWPVFSREKMMITSIAHHFRMFRRQAWERTSRFREDIVNGVDYDIFLKLAEVGALRHVEEVLYQRRWHGENTSQLNEQHQTANTHRVQREALRRQGLAPFWDLHVPDPAKPRNVTYRRKDGIPVVVFWPDYSRGNPYQSLLYAPAGIRAEVVSGDIAAAIRLIASGDVRPADTVFHLHWLHVLFRSARSADEAAARAAAFAGQLAHFRDLGGRIVWTIHNTLSHDTPFADVETELSARVAGLADRVHLHCAGSLAEVNAVFAVPAEKVRVSRHGHYIGAYPDYVDRAGARAALGIGANEDVILFTGQVRPYKGVDHLVAAFRAILADRSRTRLVIAGKTEGDALAGLGLRPAERARILMTGRFVADTELQLFFRAADIAAYPYRNILTSGSLMLALSFGVPSVTPRVAMTAKVLDGNDAGRLYEGGASGLEAALRDLLAEKDAGRLDRIAANARARARALDWPDFGPALSLG